ncbi:MAG: hypothetical protein AAF266_14855 [Planctomycetota bacterium]
MNEPNEEPPKKKAKIHTEEAKQRQVSHWDMDYLPSEQLDEFMGQDDGDKTDPSSP